MGCIMSKCLNCKIEILDETERCPLCHSILEQTEDLENMYPEVHYRFRRLDFISRLYLFIALLLEAIFIFINYTHFDGVWWCIIHGLILLYGYVVLRYAVIGKSGYRSKSIILTALFVISAVGIDLIYGYQGWSLDYMLPLAILSMDIAIIVLMIYNSRNWQSYICFQLFLVLCSIVPIILYLIGLEKQFYLAVLPMAVSASLFIGTMILGDRRARTELKRRFHVN